MSNLKDQLSNMIDQAATFDRYNDLVLRDQALRSISDLPLPIAYVRAALITAGLPLTYETQVCWGES